MANDLKLALVIDAGVQNISEIEKLTEALSKSGVNVERVQEQSQKLNQEMAELAQQSQLITNFQKLSSELEEVNTELAETEKKMASVARGDGGNYTQQANKIAKLKAKHKELNRELDATKQSMNKAGFSTKDLTSEQKRLATQTKKTNKAISALHRKTEKLTKLRLGKNLKNDLEDTKKSALSLKATLVAVGTALAVTKVASFFTSAISGAASLEEQLDKVQAVSNATAEQMAKIKAKSEELGATTRYTATQSAEGFEILARAGLNAEQSISAIPSVLALAQGQSISLADSAQYLGDAVSIMGGSFEESARYADVLAKGAAQANTTVPQLANAISYTGQYAKEAGLGIEDLVGLLDLLAQKGLRGERAGTALRNIFAQLQDPASKASKEIQKLGIDTSSLESVINGLANAGESGKAAINAFGTEAGPALRAMLSGGTSAINEYTQGLLDAGGAAQTAAQTMEDNLFGSLRGLNSAWESVKNALGEPVLKPITEQIQRLSQIIRDFVAGGEVEKLGDYFAQTFGDMTKSFVDFVQNFTLDDTTNKVNDFASNVIGSFNKVGAAFKLVTSVISVAFNGFKVSVLSVGAVVADVVALIIQGFGEIASLIPGMEDVEKGLKGVAGGLREVAKEYVESSEDAADKVVEGLNDIDEASKTLIGENEKLTQKVKDNTKAIEESTQAKIANAQSYAEKAQLIKDEIARLEENQKRIEKLGQTENEVYLKNKIALAGYQNELKKLNEELSFSQGKRANLVKEIGNLEEKQKDLIALGQQESEEAKKTTEAIKAKREEVAKLEGFIAQATVKIEQKAQAETKSAEATKESAEAIKQQSDALKTLGIDLEQVATGMSETERKMIDSIAPALDAINTRFKGTKDEAQLTQKAIAALFENATQSIKSPEGLAQLDAEFAKLGITVDKTKLDVDALTKSFEDMTDAIAKATTQQALDAQMNTLRQSLAEGKITTEQFSEATQQLVAKRGELIRAESEVAKSTKKTSGETKEATKTTKAHTDALEQTVQAAEKVADSNKNAELSITLLNNEAEKSPYLLNQVKEGLAGMDSETNARARIDAWNRLFNAVQYTSAEYNEHIKVVDSLINKIRSGEAGMSDFQQATMFASQGVEYLDAQRLDALKATIADAKAEMDALAESAKNAADAREKELLRLQGKGDEANRLDYLDKIAEIERQIDEARERGNAEAVKQLERQLALEKEIYEEKQKREKQKESSQPKPSSSSSASAGESVPKPASIVELTPINISVAGGTLYADPKQAKDIADSIAKGMQKGYKEVSDAVVAGLKKEIDKKLNGKAR